MPFFLRLQQDFLSHKEYEIEINALFSKITYIGKRMYFKLKLG